MLYVDSSDNNTIKSIDYYSRLTSIRQATNYTVKVFSDIVTEL